MNVKWLVRGTCGLVLLCIVLVVSMRAEEVAVPVDDYARVIRRTADMTDDRAAAALAAKYGLNILNLTWEDTGRFKGSAVGPNISDMTIQVQFMEPRTERCHLTCMPVIRYPNFSDKTADVRLDKVWLLVGNEAGRSLRRISLREYLGNIRKYLSKPDSWKGRAESLLAERDTHVLVSAQACFLPVPRRGKAEFNPVLFNYQSVKGDPAVLAILATREGTSATVIDNVRDGFAAGRTWGQRLFFNQNGQRASLTGERLSDFAGGTGAEPGGVARQQHGLNMVMLIQVPLKQKQPPRRYDDHFAAAEAGTVKSASRRGRSDVEEAVIGHGRVEGPFTELDGLDIERDTRFPIRLTVQYYKATSNGVVDANDIAQIRDQIDRTYRDADYVGSLVVEGQTGRPTEHQGDKFQPPGWWAEFWERYEKNTGEPREQALDRLRKMLGRERFLLVIEDPILLEKRLKELDK